MSSSLSSKKDSTNRIIDLASSSTKEARSKDESRVYLCKTCGFSLVPIKDPAYYARNPYAGPGYYCEGCHKNYDISIDHLEYQLRPVSASVPNPKKNEGKPMIMFLNENKSSTPKGRTYEDVDPEKGFDDERWKSMGAEVVDSRVQLTDSTGHTQTFVKEKPNKDRYFRPVTELE